MPKRKKYFAQYKSPNTVIVPMATCHAPSPKKLKLEIHPQSPSPQHVDISFLDDFNIDEIVESLYDCDCDDRVSQENVNDKNNSTLTMDHDIIDLYVNSSPSEENNDEKNNLCGAHSNNVPSIPLNTNQMIEVEDKEIDTIFKSDHAKINQDNNKNTEYFAPNSKCDQVLIDSNRLQSICKDANINNNYEIQINAKLTDGKGNNIVENEFNIIKNNDSLVSKKSTLVENNNLVKVNDNKDMKNSQTIIVTNGNNESLKQTFDNHIKPISAVQCRNDNQSKELGKKMSYYFHAKYWVDSVIHHGRFSKIFKCHGPDHDQYAVKMLNNKSDRIFLGIKKGKMLMDIQANIPKENLFFVYCKSTFTFNGYWCFLMDFYPKNLAQALGKKPFHINMVQDLARQLIAAVTLLRNNDIVHSDIKPSHILLNISNTQLKLCGFDVSYYINKAEISPNMHGSILYRAPEVILGYSAGFSIDVWSTAVILHEMATGRKLFTGYDNWDILYMQMCTLGTVPHEMLSRSYYANTYFVRGMFKKKIGNNNERQVVKNIFVDSKKVTKAVYDAYYRHWASTRSKLQIAMDVQKIHALINLLQQMLVICPNYRLPIELAYANPFIYEMFDC